MKQASMFDFKPCMMLFIITLSILGVAGKPKCNPEKNEYYHRQAGVCLLCETCLKGNEPIPMEMWNAHWDPELGPTECRRCRGCQPGMFSEMRSFRCKPCKNCTLYGQYESTPCTNVQDTVCDGVKPTTIRVNHTPTPKVKSDGRNDPDNSKRLNSALYIVGIVCLTIFLIVLSWMVCYCVKKKMFKKERNDHRPVEEPKANSAECKSVRIDMPTEGRNGDRQPLLSGTSDNLSVMTESVELDEIERPGLPSPSTEDPQDLSTDGDCAFVMDQEPPTNVRDGDPEHGTSDSGNSETTSTDDGTDSSTDQEGIGVDLVTDATTEKFSRKILFERQWSHPFDGRGEREYYSRASGAEAMPVVDRISKDDLSLVAKRRKKTVGENILRIASKYLVTNRLYLSVARDFELEEADIDIVKYDNKNESVQEVSYQMLLKVLQKRRLTLDDLRGAVEKHDRQAWENISSRLSA